MTATPPSQDFDHRTRITALRTQHGDGALGVPAGLIRLSWQVEAEDPDAFQAAYQLAVIGEQEHAQGAFSTTISLTTATVVESLIFVNPVNVWVHVLGSRLQRGFDDANFYQVER